MDTLKRRDRCGRSNPVPCLICDKEFSSQRCLNYHNSRFHTPARCSVCDEEFANARLLSAHSRRLHSNEPPCRETQEKSTDMTKDVSCTDTWMSEDSVSPDLSENDDYKEQSSDVTIYGSDTDNDMSEDSVSSDLSENEEEDLYKSETERKEETSSSDETLNSDSSDNTSFCTKRQIERPTKRHLKRKKKQHDREVDYPKFIRSNVNKRDYHYSPLTSAYKFKSFFKVPDAKESLDLKRSETSLIDCILATESLREVAQVMEENPRDVQSIYLKVDRMCRKLNRRESIA